MKKEIKQWLYATGIALVLIAASTLALRVYWEL